MKRQLYLDVATSRDKGTLQQRLVEFAQEAGFPMISALLVLDQPAAKPVVLSVGNTPDAYLDAYLDREDSRHDPVLTRIQTLGHPIIYDQSMYVHDGVGDLWEHQAAFGYKTGIAMALHMPHGRHFLLGVDRSDPLPADDEDVLRMMADLQLFAVYAQEAAVRVLVPEVAPSGELPTLTVRELEILRWTRDGKSAGVIADILKINVGTVNFHLQSAAAKLHVSGKHQAVVKALTLRLL